MEEIFFEGASGLTGIYCSWFGFISNMLKKENSLLDYLCIASGLINILLGAKSNSVILIIFSLIRISQIYLDFDLSKSKSF